MFDSTRLVFERRAHHDWGECPLESGSADGRVDLLLGGLPLVQEYLAHGLVRVGQVLHQLVVVVVPLLPVNQGMELTFLVGW